MAQAAARSSYQTPGKQQSREGSAAVPVHELGYYRPEAVVQTHDHLLGDVVGHAAIEGLRYSAGDAGHCIAVPAQAHRLSDRVLEVVRFQEGDYRLGHRALAGHVVGVVLSYIVEGLAQAIAGPFLDILLDLFLALPGPREEDGSRDSLGALD